MSSPPMGHYSSAWDTAVSEIMNISIDWPRGRENNFDSSESSADSFDQMVVDDVTGGVPQPCVDPFLLAEGRRRDWPDVRGDALGTPLLKIYSTVQQSGLPNMLDCRLPVPSQLNYPIWRASAIGHQDDTYVLDGVRYGFPLHYVGPPLRRPNRDAHPSATQFLDHVKKYVNTETQNLAMLGPYDISPFVQWTNISPVMTRPKSDSSKRRIIVDLSFPDGDNVNSFVHKNLIFGSYHEHRLPTVADTLAQVESMGFWVLLATIDIERAYRNIPVCPLDLPLLGIKVDGKVFIDAAMPFGARNSSLNMQLLAQFIVRNLQARGINCQMYLDDMIVQLLPSEDYHTRFREILAFYRALGLPISYTKLQPPSETVVYLGINIDLAQRVMSIPIKKIQELESQIRWALRCNTISKKAAQRIVGKINHISKCVEPARLFMARVLAALRHAHHVNQVSVAMMKPDLHWLASFLRKYNGCSIIKRTAPAKIIAADSCLTGGGGTDMDRAYELVYSQPFAEKHHISTLEAVNCLVALRTLVNATDRNTTIEVQCDSESAISALAYGRARDPVLLAVCRAAWYLAACMGINIVYTHIPGTQMQIPDALSRAHLSPQHRTRADHIICQYGLRMVKVEKWATNYANFL